MLLTSPVALTFRRFDSPRDRWWALRQMPRAARLLADVPHLKFARLLGSGGGNGFTLRPDWSTYALLTAWDTPQDVKRFEDEHPFCALLNEHAAERWTVLLQPTKARGAWGGRQPFDPPPVDLRKDQTGPLAVLTRATVRARKLPSFWRHVPEVASALPRRADGLLFSKGVGEQPLWQQATFTMWESREAMVDYAYRSETHLRVMRKARQEGWYREELFAEFVPVATYGTWPDAPELSSLPHGPTGAQKSPPALVRRRASGMVANG
ncbi:MAG: spheroidene monooxygenase [Catalinimonas sp.]